MRALAGAVCSIHSLPSWTVNSMSWMSRKCASSLAQAAFSSAKTSGMSASSDGRLTLAARRAASVNGSRRTQPCHHVLALRIDQELAVKLVGAGRRIAREHDAGRALLAHIAEHHGLHGDGRTPIVGNIVQAPIGDGARVVPGAEHGGDGAPQLGVNILREGLAKLLLDQRLEAGDDVAPMLGARAQCRISKPLRLL